MTFVWMVLKTNSNVLVMLLSRRATQATVLVLMFFGAADGTTLGNMAS